MLTGLLDIADLHYVDGPPITDVPGPTGEAPAALALAAPVPNPFTSGTTLGFALPARGPVSLDVYDLAGRRVRVLEQGERDAGRHAAHWDGRDEAGNPVRAGLYFARLRFGAETLKTRLVLAR